MSFLCRSCNTPLAHTFIDLGEMPLANDYLPAPDIQEKIYPLHAMVCDKCYLVQVHHAVPPQAIFGDYAYFSSYSSTWLKHAKDFTEYITEKLKLTPQSHVIEIASNDGYLLKNFIAKSIPCLGIEPAANVAKAALDIGVPTEISFLTEDFARKLGNSGKKADLVIANNVIAHVPDLNDFISGLALLLKPHGTLSLEFPHILTLIEQNAFDTIYHEHYSYFSLLALESALKRHGLHIYAAQKLPTHGGSLRILAHNEAFSPPSFASDLEQIRLDEKKARLNSLEGYRGFASRVTSVCRQLCGFLENELAKKHSIAAYGAAAKGNTLLNVCKLNNHHISFVADLNPNKQGKFLPGSHIPVSSPDRIFKEKPSILLILPWNIADEIREQMKEIKTWGGRFVTAIPKLQIWD